MRIQKTVDGFTFIVDLADGGIGPSLYFSNALGEAFNYSRERVFMEVLNQTVKPGMCCIDCGANIGYATMFMVRNAGENGRVLAIEPNGHNKELLQQNLGLNGFLSHCDVFQYVMSDKNGVVEFWLSDKPNLHSATKTKHSKTLEMLPCLTLEAFCAARKCFPNFIKMDVEGDEVQILNGAYDFFKKNKEEDTHILMEVHPLNYNNSNDFAAVLKKYFKIGFRTKCMISTPISQPYPLREAGYKPIWQGNADGWIRSLYTDTEYIFTPNIEVDDSHYQPIKDNDAIKFLEVYDNIPGNKIIRAMLLSRELP